MGFHGVTKIMYASFSITVSYSDIVSKYWDSFYICRAIVSPLSPNLLWGVLLTAAAKQEEDLGVSLCDAGWLPAFPGSSRHHVSVGWHAVRTGRPSRRWGGAGKRPTQETHWASIIFWPRVWSELGKSESPLRYLSRGGKWGKCEGRKERLLRSD